MAKLEKLGVILMLLGSVSFRDGGIAGLFGVLLFIGGMVAFLFGDEAHLTMRATDGAGMPPKFRESLVKLVARFRHLLTLDHQDITTTDDWLLSDVIEKYAEKLPRR